MLAQNYIDNITLGRLSEEQIAKLETHDITKVIQVINENYDIWKMKSDKMKKNYLRYKDGVTPIKQRKYKSYQDKHFSNEIHNSFEQEIIETKMSYLFSNPVIRNLKEENDNQSEILNGFDLKSRINDVDAETCKLTSICGYGANLLYINANTKEPNIFALYPWEVMFLENGFKEVMYSVRIFEDNIEIYTDKDIITLQKNKKDVTVNDIRLHGFKKNPLLKIYNNAEEKGDFENVLDLIDAYDTGFSDLSNELLEDRIAKLVIEGGTIDKEQIQLSNETGAFNFPEGVKAYYLTKEIKNDAYMKYYEKLEYNISRFSGTPDFSNVDKTGNLTNLGIAFLYSKLDQRCGIFKRKYTTYLNNLYEVLGTYYNTIGKQFDYMNIEFKWSENKPYNLLDIAQSQEKLEGRISDSSRIATIPFIDNINSEIKKIEEDTEKKLKMEQDSMGFDNIG